MLLIVGKRRYSSRGRNPEPLALLCWSCSKPFLHQIRDSCRSPDTFDHSEAFDIRNRYHGMEEPLGGPLLKAYTRTGDAGETGLYDGSRLWKDDKRVEAYGSVDELNSQIGLVCAFAKKGKIK